MVGWQWLQIYSYIYIYIHQINQNKHVISECLIALIAQHKQTETLKKSIIKYI